MVFRILFFLVITPTVVFSNIKSFEGSISFVRETVYDTTFIHISVKDNMVKVDEYNSKHKLLSSHLVNIYDEVVYALSPNQKLFAKINVNPSSTSGKSDITIVKSGNHKEINGQICYQWRVKDAKRNTEIAYWVTQERFSFFEILLRLLNRTEHSLTLFKDIPNNDGFFPMLTEERTLLRKNMLRIAVVEIDERILNASAFEIPQGYKLVR